MESWFENSEEFDALNIQLKELGDKGAIQKQKSELETKITALRELSKLSKAELARYQAFSETSATIINRNAEIDAELAIFTRVKVGENFFRDVNIEFSPAIGSLPPKLKSVLAPRIAEAKTKIIAEANKAIHGYKDSLQLEKTQITDTLQLSRDENKALLEKYQGNAELEKLVKAATAYMGTLKKIAALEQRIAANRAALLVCAKSIEEALRSRMRLLANLASNLNAADAKDLDGIRFDIEYALDAEQVEVISDIINLKNRTDFVVKGEFQVEKVRNTLAKFLTDIYSGQQKVNSGHDKQQVATSVLTLTEKVLFTAEMEGDKIGGFSESTMTAGKRALFALRLMLAESDDTWPLLIDQPEDDLDSRSIYDEVVPYLKRKKKERQIIMVSHNANLVIGSDSEQVIIANRHGNDRPNSDGNQFNYLTGSLECSRQFDPACDDTLGAQGVCEHACSILDGGKAAFEKRWNKYNVRNIASD
ncbi:TPA: hypothetical protein DIV49_02500 [Candidatus Saccharibacteria bacterium]|nr:hypothetical protein [Candidatus Saccharibacteria bacterium]